MKHFWRLAGFIFCIGSLTFLTCKKEYSCEGCNKKPPVADAGPDRIVQLPTSTFLLDGSASMDPDGSIKTFAWRKISGHNLVTIVDPAVEKTTVKYLDESICLFELKVTDDDGFSSKDTIIVTIKTDGSVNRHPVAKIDPERAVFTTTSSLGGVVGSLLRGDLSYDPDNNIVEYEWRQVMGPQFTIDNRYAANINVSIQTISLYSNGRALFELKVTDSRGLFSKATMEMEYTIR